MSLERAIRGVLTEQVAPKQVTEAKDPNEYDQEGEMMKTQLRKIDSAVDTLMNMVKDDDNLPEWIQSKITKATDYIRSVRDYLESEKTSEMDEKFANPAQQAAVMAKMKKDGKYKKEEVELDEKAMSQAQQKAAGAALAAKRGEIKPSELVGASKEMYDTMTTKELDDFASTKHKGLPKKVEEAKKVSSMQIHKVLAPTKNSREGIAALKKAFRVNDMEAKKMLDRVMNEETPGEMRAKEKLAKRNAENPDMGAKAADRKKHYDADKAATNEAKNPEETVNIRQSLKKAIDMRGQKQIVFKDGSKAKISVQDAEKAMKMLDNTRMAKAKQDLTIRMMKSHQDFKDALAGKKPKTDPFALRVKTNEAVRSADKKPEKYIGQDGKTKIRMVPADREVVKTEGNAEDAMRRKQQMDRISKSDKDKLSRVADMMRREKEKQAKKVSESSFVSKFKADLREKKRVMKETKGAPKGYHFTKDGKLKKGDAGQDGHGGKMLRSDPLDKQRSKIPPLPENDK